MFNYTREIIINKPINDVTEGSNVVEKGINKSVGNKVILERVGEYDKRNIVKVWVTEGTKGTKGTFTIKCGAIATAMGRATVVNVHLFVKAIDKYLVDYANANWANFGKSIVVEFAANNTAADVAAKMKAALEAATKDLDKMFDLTVNSSNELVGTFTEDYLAIGNNNVVVSYYDANNELVEVANPVTTTDTVAPFATAEWLVENLRFPSYPNVRYAAKNSDEYPVAGEVYDQVSFQYAVERPGLGGLSAVGQKIESVTTHVLYVKHSQAAALVAALGAAESADTNKDDDKTDYEPKTDEE